MAFSFWKRRSRWRPRQLRLEASTRCQLACPLCLTTKGKTHEGIGKGTLRFSDFRQLVDENRWLRDIELSNWGEIFLNPDLPEIIRYAYRRKIRLSAVNGTNFNHVSPAALQAMVKYRFHALTCSIDGASAETYRQYRVRGDFERVIGNLRSLQQMKQRYRSQFPRVTWQFIPFGHNQHELPRARELAKELGMDFAIKLASETSEAMFPLTDPDAIRPFTYDGIATRSEYYAKHGHKYLQNETCLQLWRQPQVNFDGSLLGCCMNNWGTFGNVFEEGLLSALNGERMQYAREMLQGKAPPRPDIPCSACKYFVLRRHHGNWLTDEQIEVARSDR